MICVAKSLNFSVCCSKGSEFIFSDILWSFSDFPACSAVNDIPKLFSFPFVFFGSQNAFCVWKKMLPLEIVKGFISLK